MKKLFALFALSVLVACAPLGTTPVAGGYTVTVKTGVGFVIASSAPIADGWLSDAPCYRQKTTAGDNNALRCVAPNVVTIQTAGQIDVRELRSAPKP